MSDYRGHVAAGAAFYAVLAFVLVIVVPFAAGWRTSPLIRTWWEIPAQLGVAVLAALWPDVDITSRGRKLFYRLFFVADLYLMAMEEWQMAALLGLFAILPGLGKHRGWTHRLWSAVLVPLPIVVVPLFVAQSGAFSSAPDLTRAGIGLPYYLAAVVGYVSHLAADGMLGRGVGSVVNVLLWPVRAVWKSAEKDHGDVNKL